MPSTMCLRYFLITYVIVLSISGGAVIGGSSIFIYQLCEHGLLAYDNVCGPPAILLSVGVIVILFGWCGRQVMGHTHKNQILCYAVLLGFIAMIELFAGVWALVRHEQIGAVPPTSFGPNISQEITEDETQGVNHRTIIIHCCKIQGGADFGNYLSASCCNGTDSEDFQVDDASCAAMYVRCHHSVTNQTRSVLLHVFLLGLCSSLFQIGCIISAVYYAVAISKRLGRRRMEIIANSLLTTRPSTAEVNDSWGSYSTLRRSWLVQDRRFPKHHVK
ncbi:CD151 antigen isoform X2 [Orussus abietinus]|uniref:CD151 antigen isoform X2 n=1 Tax=Orussus abietinus TaxID=222816 RepID=UPI000626A54B|nr:CD151 antigen isoform X2 [Orussus abietinus]